MKKKVRTDIINILNDIKNNLEEVSRFKLQKKKIDFKDGLLEWSDEERKFLKIKYKKKNNTPKLLFLDNHSRTLSRNTMKFLEGKPANSVLLWGAKGTGKSSLVLSIYNKFKSNFSFYMIEIKFFQIKLLPKILRLLEESQKKIIIFCDDFSFDGNDENFILYKNVLEGSLRINPNIIFYVTSNYRHLIRNDIQNFNNTPFSKDNNNNLISLSDRFGIWLGFHNFTQEEYIEIVLYYINLFKIKLDPETVRSKALEWSILRGSNSGREAVNFAKHLLS